MKKETIQKGINYQDYRSMVAELMQENKTTGTKQTNELGGLSRGGSYDHVRIPFKNHIT